MIPNKLTKEQLMSKIFDLSDKASINTKEYNKLAEEYNIIMRELTIYSTLFISQILKDFPNVSEKQIQTALTLAAKDATFHKKEHDMTYILRKIEELLASAPVEEKVEEKQQADILSKLSDIIKEGKFSN